MNENTSGAPISARQLTGRMLMAVVLGLGIWNLIAALMSNVVVPWLGSVIGQDAGLPSSFTRNYDYPDLLIAVLEFAIAGIVALAVNWALQRPQKTRKVRMFSTSGTTLAVPAAHPVPAPAPSSPKRTVVAQTVLAAPEPTRIGSPEAVAVESRALAAQSHTSAAEGADSTKPVARTTSVQPTPAVSPARTASTSTPTVKPAKPKKDKPVYYNLVGEPVPADED